MIQARPLAVLLMGPTASGKSRIALEVASRLPVEIVSVDSAQVYEGMDIGTAKPTPAERATVPHHLIDLLPPTEAYSAARFRQDALDAIGRIRSRGRLPLLVGGTMLYFKALIEGLSPLPGADPEVRERIDREAAALGWPAMHAMLREVDPETAARLEPTDSQRIQRALEVWRVTGQPMSRLLARHCRGDAPGGFHAISLMPSDRGALHAAIERRFDRMLERGLVEELHSLRQKYRLEPGLPSMRSVGYRQAWQHLEGEFDRDELRLRGIYATRQLAKRQMTWLRSWRAAQVIDCSSDAAAAQVRDAVERVADSYG